MHTSKLFVPKYNLIYCVKIIWLILFLIRHTFTYLVSKLIHDKFKAQIKKTIKLSQNIKICILSITLCSSLYHKKDWKWLFDYFILEKIVYKNTIDRSL